MVVKEMSRFDPKDLEIKELEDALTDTVFMNAVMQDALEIIASNTEEDRQQLAQEVLEVIAVNNNNNKRSNTDGI
jgi:hypothetical protein